MSAKHIAIHIDSGVNKIEIINKIFSGDFLSIKKEAKGELYSDISLQFFLQEEEKHDLNFLETNKSLRYYSDGEKKKMLLKYVLSKKPDFIVVDHIFDSLDIESQVTIQKTFTDLSKEIQIIQLESKRKNFLPFIEEFYSIESNKLLPQNSYDKLETSFNFFDKKLPPPIKTYDSVSESLIQFKSVSVSYLEKQILKNINWEVKKGEFWQLIGPNGSGKSTLLSMITGENPKAYGQNITIFGSKKGSGESIWDIKQKIGYYYTTLTHGFARQNTVEQMLISGFFDSIGLYTKPNESQIKISQSWLELLGLLDKKNVPFLSLSSGQQRLLMIARSMIKHPPLLLLDEPTVELGDFETDLVCQLINKIAAESQTTIIFVSHNREKMLKPKFVFSLIPSDSGSIGKVEILD